MNATDYKLRGNGRDETGRFQSALNEIAKKHTPATLRLNPKGIYSVKTLQAPDGVTIDGQGAVLQNSGTGLTAGKFMFTVKNHATLTIKNIVLRSDRPLHAVQSAKLILENVTLEPGKGKTAKSVQLLFTGESSLHARNVNALHLTDPDHPTTFQDDAQVDWQGGMIVTNGLCFLDRAGGKLMPDRLLAPENTRAQINLGRPSGKLFKTLQGTEKKFKKIIGNPRHAKALAAWKKHNATQTGCLLIKAGGTQAEAWKRGLHVHVNGMYRMKSRDTSFKVMRAFDQSNVRMQGGGMVRLEAYGLSNSLYTGVNLTAPGRDDPWHPTTTYLQGFHNMEFSRGYNDLLPRVEFRNAVIDFAGDDCLNGLPEPRAMQLMEIVHDVNTLFPSHDNLKAFEPEKSQPGTRLRQLTGAIGALHDEQTNPRLPYDFRRCGFTWRGDYNPVTRYQPGDVCAWRGILFVCNRQTRAKAPNAVFDDWQIFTMAFRNAAGYIQAARRVLSDNEWHWEKRQALGPWAGYTKRERGNPIVTYHVHLILKNVEIIRRANTWSFCCSPRVPVGNAVYDYILSSHVCNVHYNTEQNQIECHNVTLTNIGADAMPIRGLSVGPHRNIPSHSVFKNVRIRGESIGTPLLCRVDSEPLRHDNTVKITNIRTEGRLWRGPRPASNPFGGDQRFAVMQKVKPGDNFAWYDFIGEPPPDWDGITSFSRKFTGRKH